MENWRGELSIRTARLELIPGTQPLLEAELAGRADLARQIKAKVPESWPPPLYDYDAIFWMLDCIKENACYETWGFRYFVLRGETVGTVVGAGGYKGPPTKDGTLEIGYSILPEYQHRGLATEAVEGLVHRAFDTPQVVQVIAETFPDLLPSIGILQKTAFQLIGKGSEPGMIRFQRDRD
jgi:RimJ/RimL family protein N-acetyltransferase